MLTVNECTLDARTESRYRRSKWHWCPPWGCYKCRGRGSVKTGVGAGASTGDAVMGSLSVAGARAALAPSFAPNLLERLKSVKSRLNSSLLSKQVGHVPLSTSLVCIIQVRQ